MRRLRPPRPPRLPRPRPLPPRLPPLPGARWPLCKEKAARSEFSIESFIFSASSMLLPRLRLPPVEDSAFESDRPNLFLPFFSPNFSSSSSATTPSARQFVHKGFIFICSSRASKLKATSSSASSTSTLQEGTCIETPHPSHFPIGKPPDWRHSTHRCFERERPRRPRELPCALLDFFSKKQPGQYHGSSSNLAMSSAGKHGGWYTRGQPSQHTTSPTPWQT
mmetsp:Transcript_51827/g.155539  ORF Transcript_51827/g.155539 Transcript_51827/m.155539 type:complete len:222 (-) Transcript_51827:187-852(-)